MIAIPCITPGIRASWAGARAARRSRESYTLACADSRTDSLKMAAQTRTPRWWCQSAKRRNHRCLQLGATDRLFDGVRAAKRLVGCAPNALAQLQGDPTRARGEATCNSADSLSVAAFVRKPVR